MCVCLHVCMFVCTFAFMDLKSVVVNNMIILIIMMIFLCLFDFGGSLKKKRPRGPPSDTSHAGIQVDKLSKLTRACHSQQ